MIIAFVILAAIPILLYQAWVATMCWGWFITPFGLPTLTLAWAIGISTTLSIFHPKPYKKEEKRTAAEDLAALAYQIVRPTLCLLVGWIAHRFL